MLRAFGPRVTGVALSLASPLLDWARYLAPALDDCIGLCADTGRHKDQSG